MHSILWLLVIALLILHQDDWFWTDDRLVFGFMPVGLFYHACISIAAGLMWYLATALWWPEELERTSESTPAVEPGSRTEGHHA